MRERARPRSHFVRRFQPGLASLAAACGCGLASADGAAPTLAETEAFGEEAGARLSEFAHAFLEGDGSAAEAIAFATAGVRVGGLVPAEMTDLEVAGGFRVASGTPGGGEETRGHDALAAALSALRGRIGGDVRQVKVKVVGVDWGDDGNGSTTQFVAADAVLAGGLREVHTVWRAGWVREGDALKLTGLHADSFEETTYRSRDGAPLFREVTGAVMRDCEVFGSQFMMGNNAWRERIEAYHRFFKFGHNGIAVGDIDGDGLEDLYACQTGGLPNRLFLHQADGTVREAAADAGIDFLDNTRAALFADFDNDGDQDLALALNGGIMILKNDGTGTFAPELRFPTVTNAFGLAAADYDLDGDLDLYVCRYYTQKRDGAQLAVPVPYFDANNGGANFLLRNDGPRPGGWLTFGDDTAGSGLDTANARFSFAAVWEDFDRDGDPDLYVANDFGKNNFYLNEGGTFRDVADAARLEDPAHGMSVATGDLDGDGWPDLYVGNMFSSAGSRVTAQAAFRGGADKDLRPTFQRLARGNSVFRSLGRAGAGGIPRFEDVTVASGASLGRWAWGSILADFNNDGRDDVFVANGFFTGRDPDDL